jgi:AraC family transcriptional regulator
MELLKKTNRPVIDIALDLGFEYPEVFSRAFKKQFGVSPAQFRNSSLIYEGIPKACIIERDIINYRGVLAIKGKSMLLDEFSLTGMSTVVNVNCGDFKARLESQTENFIFQTVEMPSMDDLFYTLVNCHGEDNGEYTVFCGKKLIADENEHGFEIRTVPGGWYVCFEYFGDMFEIRESFNDDLYRWIMVKEAEIELNGIGMMDIFNNDYPKNNRVEILIPVKKPL